MSEWISVKERLPEDLLPVLIALDSCVMVATYHCGRFVQDSSQAYLYEADPLGDISEQPTHWMPLPPPPETDQCSPQS